MTDELGKNLRSLFDTLRSTSPSRGSEAASIASDVRSLCVERITDAELAYTSSLVFNKENGVIQFLRDSLLLDEFAVCKDELLHLLHSFVDSLGPRIASHAVDIKEVCVSLFLRDKAARVKNATFGPLTAVVKLCQQVSTLEASLNVPDMVKRYYQAVGGRAKCSSTVKGGVYQLLGTFCEAFPEHMAEYSSRIITMYIKALKEEMGSTTRKTEMAIIAGSLQGLTGYLVHFTQSAAEGAEYAKDIYLYTRKSINPEIQLTRYDVPKAGLLLISQHAAQFQEYLARDYNAMYSCLFKWCNHSNRDIKKLAFPALEAFLQQVSTYILQESDDSSGNEEMFRFFIKQFRGIIDNRSSGQREVSVAIRGYGHFAAPCRHFMKEEDIHFMFNDIIQRSEQVFSQGAESDIYHLPSLLESLASIVKEMKQLSELFLSSLERLVVMTFEYYPHLATTNSKLCHFALYKLFLVLSYHPTVVLKNFMSHIIYQGLVRSCSYPVVIDVGDGSATVSMETQATGSDAYNEGVISNKPVSYKDFVGLWSHLLNPGKIKGLGKVCNNPEQQSLVHNIIYTEMMTTIINVIQKLDLSAMQPYSDHDSSECNGDAMETDATASDNKSPPSTPDGDTHPITATGLEATVPKDFQIFINLVDLCRAILLTCDIHMFEGWIMEFGKQTIIWSTRYPLVSGFYKLLAVNMIMCRKLDYFKEVSNKGEDDAMDTSEVVTIGNSEKQLCFSLFSKFIKEVLVRMKQYKDDLLASCLHLLLSLPQQIVQVNIAALVPALQIAFKLGLSYMPLAMTGIDALGQWSRELEPSVIIPHYKHVLPYLNDYLKSSGTDAEEEEIPVKGSSRSASRDIDTKKAVQKWKEGIESSGSSLEKVRLKIINLLGSLGGCINGDLIRGSDEDMSHAIVWDTHDKLPFALPFQDMKPTMFLDPFLPRCCELATSSNDRQTKIASCELLHAIVLVMLGRAAQPVAQDKAPMNKLYRKVFPVILQLGCDVEQVAERLFSPLVFQIIHWFTSNKQYESPDTIALLEAILDGIVHPTDTSLRSFSTKCIKHFLEWSLKQTTKKQLESNPTNVKSLLKRIYSLATHPSAIKRLGAASTINTIYTVFREEDALISTFIIEMACVMLHSLKLAHKDDALLGTVEQAQIAINHVARIIRARSNLLSKPNKLRRVPRGIKSAELLSLVVWLLEQCGSPETNYRQQCMMLLVKFTTLLPGVTTASSWIRNTLDAKTNFYFIKCFEQGGATGVGIRSQPRLPAEGSFTLTDYTSWCDKVYAAIDCYSWVFSNAYLAPCEVFNLRSSSDNVPSKMLDVIGYFVSQLAMVNINGLAGGGHYSQPCVVPFLPHEEELYNKSRYTLVTELLRFLTILLQHHPKDTIKTIPESFWSDDLLTVVVLCCIDPQGVGCDLADVRQADTMYKQVKETLVVSQHLPATVRSRLMETLCKKLTDGSINLTNLMTLTFGGAEPCDHVMIDLLSSALRTLQQAHLLAGVFPSKPLQELAVELLDTVMRLATPTNPAAGSGDLAALTPSQNKTCGAILQLALEIGPSPMTLINSLITNGSHVMLYHTFPDLINAHFCTNLKNYVTLILSNATLVTKTTAHILNGLMNYISRDKQHRKHFALPFTQILLLSWQQLSSWWSRGSTDELKMSAINLLKRALVLEPKVISDVSGSTYSVTFEMFCDLLSDPVLQLSAKVKVLSLLTHFTTAPADKLSRLRDSLKRMVADQFPLKSTELPVGTPQYHVYISSIDKLLQALVVTGSNVILDVMIGIICQDPCQLHVCEEQIQLSFNKFITSVTVAVAMEAINTGYIIFTNEDGYRSDARRAVMQRVCLPLLRACSEQVLRDFFLKHICDIITILETRESRAASNAVLETQLISKTCVFALVGLLYQRLPAVALSSPDSSINKTYCRTGVKTGKELTQAVTKLAHTAKSEDLHGDTTLKELRRQYHCVAYNTLVAIVSCTQKDIKFYTGFLFTENPLKGQFLWDNLVDVERQYQFDIEVDRSITFKKQLNVIREDKQSSNSQSDESASPVVPGQPRYLSSLFLAGSSLSEDVSQFDFSTGAHVIPSLHPHQQSYNRSTHVDTGDRSELVSEEERVEQDELNTHEVMATLTQLLTHMERNKINPIVEEGTQPSEMPSWMNCLYKTFTNSSTKENVRLFIARLITNRPKVFQPYARFWLDPLIQLLVNGGNEGMHYLVVEVVVTMLTWAQTAVPDDRFMASRLLEFLMQNASHSNRQIFKNNLEIIKTLVECWRNKLNIPTKIIYQFFSNPSLESKANLTGTQLLGIIVANGLAPFDPTTSGSIDEKKFYTTLVGNLKNKYKEIYASTAEVLGMVLHYITEKKHVDSSPIHDLISSKLSEMTSDVKADDKFIVCLHKLQQFYPQFSDRFINKVLFMLPSHHGVFRTMLLEIVLSRAQVIPNLFMELRAKGLVNMIGHRDEATQLVCLQLVEAILQSMGVADVAYLLPHITSFSAHSSTQCRQLMYNILMWLYNHTSGEEGAEVLATVKDQLLQGLADDSESIRLKLFAFWNQESCLPSDALGRLHQLMIALYSPNAEREFLKYSTNLLLELTSRTPDYNKSPFDAPLSECTFEDFKNIDLSWQQKHLQMTPLFAATQVATQAAADTTGSSLQPGMIRATVQSVVFTPTQDEGGYSWMTPSVQSQDHSFNIGSSSATQEGPQSAMLFTAPKSRPSRVFKPVGPGFGRDTLRPPSSLSDTTATQDIDDTNKSQVMRLKRRFLKDRTGESSFFAKMELRRKYVRQEQRQRQKAARGSRVVLYRRYREGELPDIQIKYCDVIRPLQALAQKDSSLSRLLFSSLLTAILLEMEQVLTESEVDTTRAAIREGIQQTLQSSLLYHPPFIGGIQDVYYHEKHLQLEPSVVSTTALNGCQQLIGIMLLEKQVLNSSADELPKKSKRPRGLPSETTTMWIELGKLYKTLGNYDVLRGIFSGHVGTKDVTRLALEAEERSDYYTAQQLYKEALGKDDWPDSLIQEEEDLWDQSLLNCYEQLTKWPELEQAVMVNVDDNEPPQLDKIWEDSYRQEQYLPFILHAKLKSACGGELDASLVSFIDTALQNEERKALLENNYSDELALFYILRDDNDRADYYIDNSYQLFIRDWSNMNSLLSSAHHSRLHSLQKLREMKEYLLFAARKDNFYSTKPLDQLLEKWKRRTPHSKLDPVSVWDDIVSIRCMMLQKILIMFKLSHSSTVESISSMDCETTSVTELETKVARSIIEFYLQIANSARLQSNYEVAIRYLKITENAMSEVPGDTDLPLLLLHNVIKLRLQQAHMAATPTSWISDVVPLFDKMGGYHEEQLSPSLKRKHFMLLGNTQQLVAQALSEHGDQLFTDTKLIRRLAKAAGISDKKMEQLTSKDVVHKLNLRTLSSYKIATAKDHQMSGDTNDLVDALLAMSNWCDKLLQAEEDDDGQSSGLDMTQFPSVLISHVLKAMGLGSPIATQLFPRLLQLVEKYPDTRKLFQAKSKDVPCWMFIGWINQMVALLNKPEGVAVHDILISIATEYPQALCYPLKISTSNMAFDSTDSDRMNKTAVDKLKYILNFPLVDDFIEALEQLTSPELVFKDLCQNDLKPLLEPSIAKRDGAAIKRVWQQLCGQLLDYKSWESMGDSLYASSSVTVGVKQKKFAQDYFKKVEAVFGKNADKLIKMKVKEYDQQIAQLQEGMKPGLKRCEGAGLLKDYSPWLQNFQSTNYQFTIEIPGQYTGNSKPLPEYHVKISSFDEKVLVLSSIRKPKRITIRGDDEKEYMFLVKGGEDLRLDQRIEQLFAVMNNVLVADSSCGQRGLSLKTYQVIPMTPRLGVIEWVNNTKPLKEFLINAMTTGEQKNCGNATKLHNEWLKKFGFYKDMYKKASRDDTEKEYKKKVACYPWDLMRRAFVQLSSSPEAFLVLRSHFTKTYATLCVCQYILGIGDRHLSNFMIDLSTGGVVGIDFGHAFGTATQFLPFPELMPFRLTPQIINLLRPLTESGELRSCMIHTMRALRYSPDLLLNTMDVFVKEPSLDWKMFARKQAQVQGGDPDTHEMWYPRAKVDQAKKKLLGYNSAHVMEGDLKQGHGRSQEFPSLRTILLGDRRYNKRAQAGVKCDSVEEQIGCLIDHATDSNILGRTWGGWEPWV